MSNKTSTVDNLKKPVIQDWHRADVICGLWKLGTSLEKLGREQNPRYSPGALSRAFTTPWPKAERIIATALGVTPQAIWPSRYHSDGSPKSGRGERGLGRYKTKHSTATKGVNVYQRGGA